MSIHSSLPFRTKYEVVKLNSISSNNLIILLYRSSLLLSFILFLCFTFSLSYDRFHSRLVVRKKQPTDRFETKKNSSSFVFLKQLFLILLGKHDSGIQLYKSIKCCYKINNKNTLDYYIVLLRIQFTTLDVILIICFNI